MVESGELECDNDLNLPMIKGLGGDDNPRKPAYSNAMTIPSLPNLRKLTTTSDLSLDNYQIGYIDSLRYLSASLEELTLGSLLPYEALPYSKDELSHLPGSLDFLLGPPGNWKSQIDVISSTSSGSLASSFTN